MGSGPSAKLSPQGSSLQAVILAAGLGTRVAMASAGQPKALLRIGDAPVFIHQLRWLRKHGVDRAIIVHGPGDRVTFEAVVQSSLGGVSMELIWVEQSKASGPGDALRCASASLRPGDTVLLLADCYLSADEPMVPPDTLATSSVTSPSQFCLVRTDDQGCVVQLLDKPSGPAAGLPALIGLYRFSSGAELCRALDEPPATGELKEIIDAYRLTRTIKVVEVKTWQDLGSYESFVAAARSSVSGRAFHAFEVGPHGSVTKAGPIDLMEREASWFRRLATEARMVTPAMHSFDQTTGRLTLDLLDYPTLASLWLYEDHPPATWTFVIGEVLDTMRDAFWSSGAIEDSARAAGWCQERYVTKTISRLERWDAFSELRRISLKVGGARLPCFDDVWIEAKEHIGRLSGTAPHLVPTHGDLTFSNILLARRYGFVRLIDPTSSIAGAEPWGDPRYDVAKLRQCYAGQYDKLASGLFDCDLRNEEVQLRIYGSNRQPVVDALDETIALRGFDLTEIRLIAALQFLSMVPLHSDDPARQLAMFTVGLSSLCEELDRV